MCVYLFYEHVHMRLCMSVCMSVYMCACACMCGYVILEAKVIKIFR